MSDTDKTRLAIFGGLPVRSQPMPPRHALGLAEKNKINEVIDYYHRLGLDPGYQGQFEKEYCEAFSTFMGGGYADAVSTGTASVYLAIAALDLPKNSEILVSPITDPGTLSAIVLSGHVPKLIDTAELSYNVDLAGVIGRSTDKTRAIVLVHSAGEPISSIENIIAHCRSQGIKVIEDCSQAHGALVKTKRVGTFGDIAAFSTMYRKAHISGASGGIVYTNQLDLHRNATAHADRGKPRWQKDFDDRDPSTFLFPALNFHTDEISCGIGIASLDRLDESRQKRLNFLKPLIDGLLKNSRVCNCMPFNSSASPFYFPIFVNEGNLRCSKIEFAKALMCEGIPLNIDYKYVAYDWPWLRPYLADSFDTPNARKARDSSFCLYLNENYGNKEVTQVLDAIGKVENYYTAKST